MARYSRNHHPRVEEEAPPVKITRQTLREVLGLFAYLLPYKYKFVAALAALVCTSLLSLVLPYVIGNLIDGALAVRVGEAPGFWAGNINAIAVVLLVVLALQACFSFVQSIWFNAVGERSLADLRRDTYARLICLPMAFFAQRRVGELTSRISADLAQIQDTLIGTVPHFLRQLTLLTGGVVLIVFTSGTLTLVMLSSLPALIGVAMLLGRRIRRASRDAQDKLADSSVIIEETLQGIANVKAFVNEGYELARYHHSLQVFLETALRGARYRAAFVSFIVFALFGGIVFVLWYGSSLVQSGELSAGELTRFMLYTMFVAGALGSFAELYSQIQRAIGASHRVRELLRETPEPLAETRRQGDREPASPLPVSGLRLSGDVVFDQVVFSYPSRKEVRVLKEIALTARAGERVALVGPSGGGKSTIVALLLRFYDPDQGQILIAGKNAREYALPELRSQMAIVPQDVLLFGGSIAENIAYGKPGASEAEIISAAKLANAHDFISSFPEGYQTLVGERGIKLSGGQRQRVAIARAILKNPSILLLDEATSSLDSESESLVQQALDVLMQGRTSFIIAHRLATVRTADRIYVIKDGETVEAGTHAELVERANGVYRTLSELQFDLS
jgi:ABC transporter fused permease/ATP-binding protein